MSLYWPEADAGFSPFLIKKSPWIQFPNGQPICNQQLTGV